MESLLETEPKVGITIHILSTSLQTIDDVSEISEVLDNHESILRWSVDLHDWEKVLKVVSTSEFRIQDIQNVLHSMGFDGAELSD